MRIIKTTNISCTNIVYHDHHLVKNDRIVALENAHLHHNNILKLCFPHLNLNWKLIYPLPWILNDNTSLRAFWYKVLNNVLYLNHKLFQFKVCTTSLCLYFNQHNETVQHYNIFSALSTKYFIIDRNQTLFCKLY